MLRLLIKSTGREWPSHKFSSRFYVSKVVAMNSRQFNYKSAPLSAGSRKEVTDRGEAGKTIGFWVRRFPRAECHRGFTSASAALNEFLQSRFSRLIALLINRATKWYDECVF